MKTSFSKEQKLTALNRAYHLACMHGLASDMKSFAEFIGKPHTNLSSAMGGNESYLTDNFIVRLDRKMLEYGINIFEGSLQITGNTITQGDGSFVGQGTMQDRTPDFLRTIDKLTDEISREMKRAAVQKKIMERSRARIILYNPICTYECLIRVQR